VKGTIALTVLEPGYAQQRWDDEHSRDERRRRIERTLRNAEREMEFILKADTI
jgi:mannosyltransferase OCH1-like enzyme